MTAEYSTETPLMNRLARAIALLLAGAVFWISQPSAGTSVLGQSPVPTPEQVRDVPVPAPSGLVAPQIEEEPAATSLPEATPVVEAVAAEAAVEAQPVSPVVPAAAAIEQPAQLPLPVTTQWVVQINPAPQRPELVVQGRSYNQIYESIPYRQAEYLANPGYRHEATMEILFGQMRPTTVVKQYTPRTIHNPKPGLTQPYRATPSDYYSYPWSGYMFPGAFFGYPGFPGILSPPLTY